MAEAWVDEFDGGGLSTVPSRLDLLAKGTVSRDRGSVRDGGSALTSALREVYPCCRARQVALRCEFIACVLRRCSSLAECCPLRSAARGEWSSPLPCVHPGGFCEIVASPDVFGRIWIGWVPRVAGLE
jgi:hypothetical protein